MARGGKNVKTNKKTAGIKKTENVEKNTCLDLERHCGICGLTNFSPKAFAKHKAEMHPNVNREFECTLCDAQLFSSNARTLHYRSAHPKVHSWICQKCGHTAPRRDKMRDHYYCSTKKEDAPKGKRISLDELDKRIGLIRKDATALTISVDSVDDASTVYDDSIDESTEESTEESINELFIDLNEPIIPTIRRYESPIMDFTGIDEITEDEYDAILNNSDLPDELEIDINIPWSCGSVC